MIRTIQIATHISVQGLVEREETGGIVVVRVGDKTYAGRPVG